jgi:glutamate-5-semialdehyde dehydrogenase
MLAGPVKEAALRAMADRLAEDEEAILAANKEDVEAVGKTLEGGTTRERVKEAVARVRMTSDDVKEMADRLRLVADLPDPVGLVTGRWERPDGLQVSRVRVPLGVIGVISELKPLITVESLALCLKSGNVCVFRAAPEWSKTHHVIEAGLREAATQAGVPAGAWVLLERNEKEAALELMRAGKSLDAIIPRGGAGLRKAVFEQARMPILCYDGGVSYVYVDADADIPMAQNVVINSKIQEASAPNSVDTLLVHQGIARPFLPALIRRLLDEYKVEILGCPKTVALMGQMSMTGYQAVKPAADDDWNRQFQAAVLAIRMIPSLDEALDHIRQHGPCLTAVIATSRYDAAMRFTRDVDATAVMVNASSRLNAGDSYGFGAHIGLSASRIHTKGPIGPEQLTNEKYVVFGTGQLRYPHPVPETYEDAMMLKRF